MKKSPVLSCYTPSPESTATPTFGKFIDESSTKFIPPPLQKSTSNDTPSNTKKFSYDLERIRSVSMPCTNSYLRTNVNQATAEREIRDTKTRNLSQDGERNGLNSTLWDSLRPRTGLPHQYQGTDDDERAKKKFM